MNPTPVYKNTIRIAAILGIIQGVSWVFLATTIVVKYYGDQHPKRFSLHYIILNEVLHHFESEILSGVVFHIFVWSNWLVNSVWVFFSIGLLKSSLSMLRTNVKRWLYTTITVSLLDYYNVVLLGLDYRRCLDLVQSPTSSHNHLAALCKWPHCFDDGKELYEVCFDGILPVLTIAARGYILLFINLVFIAVLIKYLRSNDSAAVSDQLSLPCALSANEAVANDSNLAPPRYSEIFANGAPINKQLY